MAKPALPPDLYLNRELGQLEFNRRVLALAADPRVPALERLRYLCIVDSNICSSCSHYWQFVAPPLVRYAAF